MADAVRTCSGAALAGVNVFPDTDAVKRRHGLSQTRGDPAPALGIATDCSDQDVDAIHADFVRRMLRYL